MALINISLDKTQQDPGTVVIPVIKHAAQDHMFTKASMDDLISGGTQYFITNGNWSLYDLLLKISEKISGRSPLEVFLTFYSMTELSARILAKLVQAGSICQLSMIYDRKSEIRYPNVHQILRSLGTMTPLHVHAKILVIRSQDRKNYVTVIGSANWTRNPRVETGIYDTSSHTAEMFIQWFTEIQSHV